jgi:ankyrin repeat protein
MRLLEVETLRVVEFSEDDIPRYAILSHTWGREEVTFQELSSRNWLTAPISRIQDKAGFSKIKNTAKLARRDGFGYIWIDTCCIDKSSSAELSEAINSMYRWYQGASACYAYLSDVKPRAMEDPLSPRSTFCKSRWFTRGWTLQELIAPKDIGFYASDWSFLGSKLNSPQFRLCLTDITDISGQVLEGTTLPGEISVANRMKWAAYRQTTRQEDIAYCLMGLFGVNMPLLYGEGKRAFIRLQEEILKETDDQSIFSWSLDAGPGKDPGTLYGLLAPSPLHFGFCDTTRPLPPLQAKDSVPSSITNQGLRISFYLHPLREDDYHGVLDCSIWTDEGEMYPAIYLRRLWGDQFARILPNRIYRHAADDDTVSADRYQTIYVKQNPSYPFPEFTVNARRRKATANSLDMNDVYHVQEAYPPDAWDARASFLKSTKLEGGCILAVLRFSSSGTFKMVDIVVGLRRNNGRWTPWYQQRRCDGDRLEEVFGQVLQPEYLALLPWDKKHADTALVPTDISMAEVDRRGRRYIDLEVTGRAELQALPSPSFTATTSGSPIPEPLSLNPRPLDQKTELEQEIERLTQICWTPDKFAIIETNTEGSGNILTNCVRTTDIRPSLARDTFISEMGMIPRSQSETQCADIILTCRDGNTEGLLELFRGGLGIHSLESTDPLFDDCRPIHWATLRGDLGMFDELVNRGAKVDSQTGSGWAAVHLAALCGFDDILGRLFEDENLIHQQIDRTLETPLHVMAAYSGSLFQTPEIAKRLHHYIFTYSLFHQNYLNETPLHRAAAAGNLSAVNFFLQQPEPASLIAAVDKFDRSVMFHAACGGNPDTIRQLDSIGASLDLGDKYGRSPLHAAVMADRVEALIALLQAGANPNNVTHLGFTAVHFSALYGYRNCLEALATRGADLERGTVGGIYIEPIHLAVASGNIECVEVFREAGCKLDRPCSHYVVLENEGPKKKGRLVKSNNLTPVDLAEALGYGDITSYLRTLLPSPLPSPVDLSPMPI